MDNSMGFYGGGLLVVVVVALLFALRQGRATSVGGAVEQMVDAATVARELVAAAEQLWLTGRLQRGERLDYVLDKLGAYFPDIDDDALIAIAEAAVYWLKLAKLQMPTDLPALFDSEPKRKVGGPI